MTQVSLLGNPLSGSANAEPLRFIWWNVESFAHYEPKKRTTDRWPVSASQYAAKCASVDAALRRCIDHTGDPAVVAFGEITAVAAEGVRQRLFPNYRLLSLDLLPNPDFHVAVLYPHQAEFEEVGPFAANGVPESTRPMAVVDFFRSGHQIRFIAAHWTAPFDEEGEGYQGELARQLRGYIYDFLNDPGTGNVRHVVLLGDFNSEPFGVVEKHLKATRSRARATRRSHYADRPVKRVRLYNCGWRLLGERMPHGAAVGGKNVAGSYYWAKNKTWHTWDQVLVSGSLLSREPPYLLEESVMIYYDETLVDGRGHPRGFNWSGESSDGASDHLPLTGAIVVPVRSELV